MARQFAIYKCSMCDNIFEVIRAGEGEPNCCGEPMKVYKENTMDADWEQHVPEIEKVDGGFRVKVGSDAHPMGQRHYIEWIELFADGKAYRQFLKPGEAPEATFRVDAVDVTAREWCSRHRLWKA